MIGRRRRRPSSERDVSRAVELLLDELVLDARLPEPRIFHFSRRHRCDRRQQAEVVVGDADPAYPVIIFLTPKPFLL